MSEIFSTMPGVKYPQTQSAQAQEAKNTQKTSELTAAKSQITVKDALPASKVNNGPETDVLQSSSENGSDKKGGPVKSVKGFIANVKKFFISTGEYTKGAFKGIGAGAVAGSIVYTGGSILNHFKSKGYQKAAKAAEEAGTEFTKKFRKFPNKALAVIAAGAAVAINIWNASLNATEKQSGVDHRYIGHNK